MVEALFHWLYETPMGEAVRYGDYLFPWLESVHVLALSLTFGSIFAVDLRLLGMASLNWPLSKMTKDILPLTWAAFVVAVITGTALLSSNAVKYWENDSFRLKMLFMLTAGLNMIVFHFVSHRSTDELDQTQRMPATARLAATVSISAWLGVIIFGRWIGYTDAW